MSNKETYMNGGNMQEKYNEMQDKTVTIDATEFCENVDKYLNNMEEDDELVIIADDEPIKEVTNHKRISTILYFIASACFYGATIMSFAGNKNLKQGFFWLCIGTVWLCLGSVEVRCYKNDEKGRKSSEQV